MAPEAAVVTLAAKITELIGKVIASIQTKEQQKIPIYLNVEKGDMNYLVNKAKGILDKPSGLDLEVLKDLACKQIKAERYVDAINLKLKNESELDITWEQIKDARDELQSALRSLTTQCPPGSSQPSNNETADDLPPVNERRCLIYLSRFPETYVFNWKRIARLSSAHEFSREDSDQSLLEQVAKFMQVVDESHFQIRNGVQEQSRKWPESASFSFCNTPWKCRGTIPNGTGFSSFISLGKSPNSLNSGKEFLLLRILTLRNVNLENSEYLKKLSLLLYLDLKHTKVDTCDHWLHGLEELQVLDLRYTRVQKISEECLEKLVNLQHLLLGCGTRHSRKGYEGAVLNIGKLKTDNLKTLRAVLCSENIINENCISRKVDDFYVTGLTKSTMASFWEVLRIFKNLTRLGVALTNGSVKLQNFPQHLKKQLRRLLLEGEFSNEDLNDLSCFNSLVDLTVVSSKQIDINTILSLQTLHCLRLYGLNLHKGVLIFEEGFKTLKKLVIGNMDNVKEIQIHSTVIKAAATLKLWKINPKTTDPFVLNSMEKKTKKNKDVKPINIFVTGRLPTINFGNIRKFNIYSYDMNKQCYDLE